MSVLIVKYCPSHREPATLVVESIVAAGMMAYTARRRTVDQVKKMMAAAESPADAVTRVSNTMHGRKAGDDVGDDDLLVSNTVISLKDPLSGTRIQYAARLPSNLLVGSGSVHKVAGSS